MTGVTIEDFDSNGDAVALNEWKSFQSIGPSTNETRRGNQFGSLSRPSDAAEPMNVDVVPPFDTPGPASTTSNKGYQVDDALAVIKWDVSGGFTYV